ncbi:C39 family peptidase [Aeromicrobium sp.]|uniref:C39 family peptidase n=1 Tax=Aeromicrobium sp. TaxID=1871063 RepID=UPI002FCA9E07
MTLADTPQAIAEKPLTDALMALDVLYLDRAKATLDQADTAKLDKQIDALQAKIERLSGMPIEKIAPEPAVMRKAAKGASAKDLAVLAAPSSHYLNNYPHSTQSNAYYCGPASVAMALRAMGASNTSDLGHTMTQTVLASSTYLGTIAAPGGGTNIYRIPTTMSKWAGVVSIVYTNLNTAATLKSRVLISNGEYGKAQVYGTRELPGEQAMHYNDHHYYHTTTLDHFIMGYGYSESGNRIHYSDPVAGRWALPLERRSMTTGAMASFTNYWGIVA